MSILAKLFGNIAPAPQPQSPAQAANPALQAQQAAANAQSQPGNIPATNPNPADPANPTIPLTAEPQGLDKFKDVWTPPKPEDMPKAPESAFAGVTPEAVKAVAAKTDFSKVVTPEMMAAISAGGEGAVAATLQAMNAMAQENYAQSATASMRLIETALDKQRTEFEAALPNLMKSQTVSNNLRGSNPIFNHPAAAPMLKTLAEQIQLKNPTATPEQIQAQAQEFLISFAGAAAPVQETKQQKSAKANEPSWDTWL
jgi:hypothetical protein